MKVVEIFCCYARRDRDLLIELRMHLMPLQRQGLITIWSDSDLNAGAVWEEELHSHLECADIFLLLISPDFMASNYCYGIEMQRAIERHNQGSARVIPVLLRPVFWQNTPFARLQVIPTNAEPVTSWSDRDRAFSDITDHIYQVIAGRQVQPNQSLSEPLKLPASHKSFFRSRLRISFTRWLTLLLLVLLGGSILLIWSGRWGTGALAPSSRQMLVGHQSPSSLASPLRYAADWRTGFDHWAGAPFWRWSGQERGTIFTTAAVPNDLLAAPIRPLMPPYTIEAQIQRQGYGGSAADGRDYGVVVQMVGGAGYLCGVGVHNSSEHAFLASISILGGTSSASQMPYYQSSDLKSSPLSLDTQWHTYRVEVTKSSVTCSIDGQFLHPASIAAAGQAGGVGIFVDHAAIAVRSFHIL